MPEYICWFNPVHMQILDHLVYENDNKTDAGMSKKPRPP